MQLGLIIDAIINNTFPNVCVVTTLFEAVILFVKPFFWQKLCDLKKMFLQENLKIFPKILQSHISQVQSIFPKSLINS